MKPRPAPRPINYKRPLARYLKSDPQVIKWVKRLSGDAAARPTDLSEAELAFVVLEVAKRRKLDLDLDQQLFVKAMADTCPVIAAPAMDRSELAEDLTAIWSQPEMREFWQSWDGLRADKGPQPNYLTGKALAVVMGMAGVSAHADDAYDELASTPALWDLFERLNQSSEEPVSYQNALKQLPRLDTHELAVKANVRLVRELAKLHPGRGIGERLMIDGMAVPAWCKQAPKGKTAAEEEERRRFTPHAGARALIQGSASKRNVRAGETGPAQAYLRRGKFWRGYYLVVIADQATGLPLVWMVVDAEIDEASCLIPLLSDLHRAWPDCPARLIAGDSAWDEDAFCRVCEVDYGIHPIFRLHDASKKPDVSKDSRDGSVGGMTARGQLICRAHNRPLKMKSAELASRAGLRPGQTAKEGAFRIRGTCPDGCGDIGLRMSADWSRLTFYPHHSHGKPAAARYAMRMAMLTRLNGIEGIFQRLQAGKKLGTKDADRTRVRRLAAHEGLIDLALLSMTAAALTDQRSQKGVAAIALPPAPRHSGSNNLPSTSAVGSSKRRLSRANWRNVSQVPAPPETSSKSGVWNELLCELDAVVGI